MGQCLTARNPGRCIYGTGRMESYWRFYQVTQALLTVWAGIQWTHTCSLLLVMTTQSEYGDWPWSRTKGTRMWALQMVLTTLKMGRLESFLKISNPSTNVSDCFTVCYSLIRVFFLNSFFCISGLVTVWRVSFLTFVWAVHLLSLLKWEPHLMASPGSQTSNKIQVQIFMAQIFRVVAVWGALIQLV